MTKKINIAIIGFTKCGTHSLEHYLKKKYPKSIVERTESTYEITKKHKILKPYWSADKSKPYFCEWKIMAITRNPIDRIHSLHQHCPDLKGLPVKELLTKKVECDCNYAKYVKTFEEREGVKVEVVRLEDMVKLKDFPHSNISKNQIKWSKKDYDYVNQFLTRHG